MWNAVQQYGRAIEENRRGVAMAMAIKAPYVPVNQRFALSVGVGSFEKQEAAALSGAIRANDKVQFDFAIGSGGGSTAGGRIGFTTSW